MAESRTYPVTLPRAAAHPMAATGYVLAVPLLLWAIFWHGFAVLVLVRHQYLDFGRFYYAARAWWNGGSLYEPTLATWLQLHDGGGLQLWNLNPPHVSVLLWPLLGLRVDDAWGIWTLAMFLCLAWAGQVTVDTLGLRPSRARVALVAAFALASTPSLANMATGQITGVLVVLTVYAWRAARRDDWRTAGALIGVLVSLKLFLAPLAVLLLLRRQWRATGLAVATCLGCFALGLLIFGWSEHVRWLETLRDVSWEWLVINSSALAPFRRVAYIAVDPQPGQIAALTRTGLLVGFGLLGVGCVVAWRDPSRDRAWLLVIASCILASPVGWLYYWWLFAPMLVACWQDAPIRRAFWCSLPAWLVPFWFLWPAWSLGQAIGVSSLYFWGLLIIWSGGCLASIGNGS